MYLSLLITSLLLSLYSVSAFTSVPSASDELQIRNKLSLYAVAIDLQNFALLDDVFTRDVIVDYRVPNATALTGLPAVKQYLVQSLTGFVTQHTLSTTVVEGSKGGRGKEGDAQSVIYLVANYLGQGELSGQLAVVYGKYSDEWVKGRGGEWRSTKRTLDLIPPGFSGNLAVLSTPNLK